MTSSRVLIVGVNYAPEQTGIGPYTTAFAESLAARGHAVTVLTTFASYPAWKLSAADQRRLFSREVINGVTLLRGRIYVPKRQSAVMRGLYELSFLWLGLLTLKSSPDLIIGIVPSLSGGVLARILAMMNRVPYGVVLQDALTRAASETGVPGARGVIRLTRAVEGWACRGAKAVGIITDGFRPIVESFGVPAKRIRRLRNWPVDQDGQPGIKNRRAFGWPSDSFICLHSGNMGYKQGLDVVIAAAEAAQAEHLNWHFVLCGDGSKKAELVRAVQDRNIRNVEFLPLQSRERFRDLLATADVALITQRATVQETALPSKLTAYAAAGLPTIACVHPNSEIANELSLAGCALVTPPEDPTALVTAIKTLVARPALRISLRDAGRHYAATVLDKTTALGLLHKFVADVRPSSGCSSVFQSLPTDCHD